MINNHNEDVQKIMKVQIKNLPEKNLLNKESEELLIEDLDFQKIKLKLLLEML